MNKARLAPMQEESSAIMDSPSSWSSIKLLTCIWAEAIEAYANQERLLFIVNSQSEEAIRLFAEYYSILPLLVKKTSANCTSRVKIINPGAVLIPIFKSSFPFSSMMPWYTRSNVLEPHRPFIGPVQCSHQQCVTWRCRLRSPNLMVIVWILLLHQADL